MPIDFALQGEQATREIADAAARIDASQADAALDMILGAQRIALYGLGREGLMMKAFAMRLFHLGLDVHVVGDMTTPPLGKGDLLLVSSGPGDFSTGRALVGVARQAGAATLCFTAQPEGATPRACDSVLVLPAQTMADDMGSKTPSLLPMGSLFEGLEYIVFELLILALRDRLGESGVSMRGRHTNLE